MVFFFQPLLQKSNYQRLAEAEPAAHTVYLDYLT
jgi:hypothetical protein